MKTINKSKAYVDLKYIKENCNVNTKEHFEKVLNSDSVPVETVIFINKYKPIEQFYTYNKIYENRRKNPLYKNLVNEDLSEADIAIALSSLVTQSMIHNKELLKEQRYEDSQEFLDMMNLTEILDSLTQYSVGDSNKLHESHKMVRDVFKKLF